MKLLFHGAESKVYLIDNLDTRGFFKIEPEDLSEIVNDRVNFSITFIYDKEGYHPESTFSEGNVIRVPGNIILKVRYKKNYRNEEIDREFRRYRTRIEAKILKKLENKVKVPGLFYVNEDFGILVMEYVDGIRLSEILENINYKDTLYEIGKIVGRMHREGVVHNDLTTSNFLLYNGLLYIIDFGLSFFSKRIEDYAVDIHLFKESLDSRHWKISEYFENFLEGYKDCFLEMANDVINRLKKIETRGRYKKFI